MSTIEACFAAAILSVISITLIILWLRMQQAEWDIEELKKRDERR